MGGAGPAEGRLCCIGGRSLGSGGQERLREVRGGNKGGKICNLHLLASEGAGSPTCRPTVYEVRKETCNDWGNDNLGDQPFFGV